MRPGSWVDAARRASVSQQDLRLRRRDVVRKKYREKKRERQALF